MSASVSAPAAAVLSPLERYYRFHSRIYDATRWSFLFGRSAIIEEAARFAPQPRRILEIGCGTGRNLALLARRFPAAHITGLDLSAAMLALAAAKTASLGPKVRLLHQAYDVPLSAADSPGAADAPRGETFDLILFSYALSMFNPGSATAIRAAALDLAPGGHLAVVDFHASPGPAFRRWMGMNHVRMEAHLQPLLRTAVTPLHDETRPAYAGLWRYLLFVGQKR